MATLAPVVPLVLRPVRLVRPAPLVLRPEKLDRQEHKAPLVLRRGRPVLPVRSESA